MLNLIKLIMLSYFTYFYSISAGLIQQMIKTLDNDIKWKLGYILRVRESITY